MGGIFFIIMLIGGGYIFWKKLTTKKYYVDRDSDDFGYLRMFLFIVFYPIVTVGTCFIFFYFLEIPKNEKVSRVIIMLIVGVIWFYLTGKIENSTVRRKSK